MDRRQRFTSGPGHASCGLVQLRLSRRAAARRKLRAIAGTVPLSLRELAAAIGVEYCTITNHLAGRRMAQQRCDWYHRLEAVDLREDGRVCLTVRVALTRKRGPWQQKRARPAGWAGRVGVKGC